MRVQLESKGYDAEKVSSTLLLLLRDDYLNDDKFAAMLVDSRTESKLWGKRRIAMDLGRRGVPKSVIDESLKGLDNRAETRTAEKALEKWARIRTLRKPFDEKMARSAYRHLEARGFSASLIIPLLKEREKEQTVNNDHYEIQ
jgi:regulatory protein